MSPERSTTEDRNIIRKAKDTRKAVGAIRKTAGHIQKIREILREEDLSNDFSIEEHRLITQERIPPPPPPKFPWIMLFLAGCMDVLGMIEAILTVLGAFTGVGAFIAWLIFAFIKVCWFIISFIWYFKKIKFAGIKKSVSKWLIKGLIQYMIRRGWIIIAAEFVPILGALIPGNIIMIFWAHGSHKKIVRVLDEIIQIVMIFYTPKRR